MADPPFDGYYSILVDKPVGQGAATEGSVKVFLSIASTGASGSNFTTATNFEASEDPWGQLRNCM